LVLATVSTTLTSITAMVQPIKNYKERFALLIEIRQRKAV